MLRPALALLALAGCGTLGGDGGGGANLPNRGLVPYARVAGAGPGGLVLAPTDPAHRFEAPAARVAEGKVELFFADRGPTGTAIRLAEADPAGEVFGLTRELALGRSDLFDPSVLADAGRTLLVAATAGGRLALFERRDGVVDAAAFVPVAAEVAPDAGAVASPSLVRVGDRYRLYFLGERDGARGVFVAEADASLLFGPATEVFGPGVGCVSPAGDEAPCFDGQAIEGPEVRLAITALDRPVLRLVYVGRSAAGRALGFAAAEPGGPFVRYPENPILDDRDVDEAHPTNARSGDRFLLYLSEVREGVAGVALYVNDRGLPSERF